MFRLDSFCSLHGTTHTSLSPEAQALGPQSKCSIFLLSGLVQSGTLLQYVHILLGQNLSSRESFYSILFAVTIAKPLQNQI